MSLAWIVIEIPVPTDSSKAVIFRPGTGKVSASGIVVSQRGDVKYARISVRDAVTSGLVA